MTAHQVFSIANENEEIVLDMVLVYNPCSYL